MRVIAGSARGTRLRVARNSTLRPTADRARETLFNVLGDRVQGRQVLDLFAGTGALGIEALSRGAASALFVERHRGTGAVLADNLARCRMQEQGRLLALDWSKALRRIAGESRAFDLIFADPPYDSDAGATALAETERLGLLLPEPIAVLEHRTGAPPILPGWRELRALTVGDTTFSILCPDEAAGERPEAPGNPA